MLAEYVHLGGLPEIVLSPGEMKNEITQSYYKTVVRGDISERYGIRNLTALKTLLRLLLKSKTVTLTKLYNSLKSFSVNVGKNTVAEYLQMIESCYFFKFVTCFFYKVKDEMQHPRKSYVIDSAFLQYVSTRLTSDYGWLYEITVVHQLHRSKLRVNYWKAMRQDYEIDFVIQKNNRLTVLIQVCYDIGAEATLQREIRALLKASDELNCRNLIIITQSAEKKENFEWFGLKGTIKFVPLWKWLLYN